MIKNQDIIIVSLQPWDIGIGSNCKDIARELSKYNRVLYVNSPLDRMTVLRHGSEPMIRKRREARKVREQDLTRESQNLWVLNPSAMLESISRLRWDWLFDKLNHVNNERFAREIKSAIHRLQFRDYIIFNDGNMFRGFYLKEMLKPQLYVYYFRDNFLAMDFWKVQGTRIQPRLMAKSDLVLANSRFLANMAEEFNRNTVYVGQGFDAELYDKTRVGPVPHDMQEIPHPIIGYTGALISLRLDLPLIVHLARTNPSWNIVLIGPEDDDFRQSELHAMENVRFPGLKSPEGLPAYISCFDVCINPQVVNDLTRGNYPRKVDEYLALGKPVVATSTPAMEEFAQVTYLASSASEFSGQVRRALEENSPALEKERELFASTHSWTKTTEVIGDLMDLVMHGGKIHPGKRGINELNQPV
jgi:glycosyltransferase involved in cell wall biosynthesis